jgi:hypothetical protein
MKKLPSILKYSILTSLVGLLFVSLATTVKAQTQRTMTIVPPSVATNLNPGGSSEGKLKVVNDSDTPLTFTAIMRDFVVEDAEGTPKIMPPDSIIDKRFSASKWVAIYPSTFTVAPHEKQELNFYIQVPNDARPGGHYAAVVYTPGAEGGPQGSGASVSTQVGTLFYVGVNGPITEKAEIIKFFTNPFQEYGPVKISTQIRNLGDLHIKPNGTIMVSNVFGGKVAELKVEGRNIFPGGIVRDYENTFNKNFLIGPYTAKFTGTYGKESNLPLVASVTFWVFPWKITLIIILIIVAIILGRKYMNKKKGKKIEEPKVEEKSAETTETPKA